MDNAIIIRIREDMTIATCQGDTDKLLMLLHICHQEYNNIDQYPKKLNLFNLLGNSITYGQTKCFEVLINHLYADDNWDTLRVNLDILIDEYIKETVELGNIEILNILLDKVDINKGDCYHITPLHLACKEDNLDIVKLLIEKGANIDVKDNCGNAPIHLAAQNIGSFKCVQYLVDMGADINVTNVNDESVLFSAVLHGNCECARFLLDKCPSLISKRSDNGTSISMFAAVRGHYECLELFFDRGCDVNERDLNQYTILHHAVCQTTTPEVIHLVINKGADINSSEKHGKTPLHLTASQKNTSENVKILLIEGALIDESATSNYTKNNKILIRKEIKNRERKKLFDIVANSFIEYLPYNTLLYNQCYPFGHKGVIPIIGWRQAKELCNSYYHKEVLHLLNFHLTNLFSNRHPTISSLQHINSNRNNTKINLVMIKLQKYIITYLTLSPT